MQGNPLHIHRHKIITNLHIHLTLDRVKLHWNSSFHWFLNIREAFDHGSTNTDPTNKIPKLILPLWLNTHYLTIARSIIFLAVRLTKLPIAGISLRVQPVKQRPDLTRIIDESCTSHNVLVLRL